MSSMPDSNIDARDYAGSARFLGAKRGSGVYQTIIAQMPPHDTYIETHFGTGAIMRLKPRAARSIAIEIDPETLAAYPPPDFRRGSPRLLRRLPEAASTSPAPGAC
jgi:DNA adenine methylase